MPTDVLELLTTSSLWLERLCPLLLLPNIFGGISRLLTILIFSSFHIAIRCTLDIGHFSYISMALWSALLPRRMWQRPAKPSGEAPARRAPHPASHEPTALRIFLAFTMYLVVAWNIGTVDEDARCDHAVPCLQASLCATAHQMWNMFSRPLAEDGWHEVPGKLRGGRQVDLMGWGGPVPRLYRDLEALPAPSGGTDRPDYFQRRWPMGCRKYNEFAIQGQSRLPSRVRRYICRIWNGPGYEEDVDDLGQLLTFRKYTPLLLAPLFSLTNWRACHACALTALSL